MSVVRNAPVSRKGEIPGNFMLKWQSSATQGVKPRVRRPVTACQLCRTAKVKCDGQPECGNCTSRGIICIYTNTDPAQRRHRPASTHAVSPPAGPQISSGEISTGVDVSNATTRSPMDTAAYEHVFDSMADWTNETTPQRLPDFNWGSTDPSLNDFNLQSLPNPPSLDLFHSLPSPESQSLAQATSLFRANFGNAGTVSPSSTSTVSLPGQLFSSPKCRCRERLAVRIPQVNSAIQEKQLDQVVKVTQKVMDSCQDIVNCTGCQIGCTDLICIMAVIQQTDTCFEYIAKADLDSAITVNFGGHDIPINDPKLRAMLVINLIQQATMVLDAISAKGQSMLRALCPPTTLAQGNIGYLETVIRDFRSVLRRVADMADKTGSIYHQHVE